MRPADAHTIWSEVLFEGLAAAGVREVLASPGSRSAPLALAAAATPRLRTSVLVDERVAAFVALGQGRVSGRPSVLLCTSGTAPAHYLPALVEASEAEVPLLAVTADRPAELQGRQAAQTTDQVRLFGSHARASLDLTVPAVAAEGTLAELRELAALAVARTADPRPGPVHVNVHLAKPLEPRPENEADAALRAAAAALSARGGPRVLVPRRGPAASAAQALAAGLAAAPRGVILAGPGPLAQVGVRGLVRALSERLGYPLLAEATSQLRFAAARPAAAVDFLELLAPWRGVLEGMAPEVVVQVGRPVTSAAWARWLERRPRCRLIVLASHGWCDPSGGASEVVLGDLDLTLAALVDALGPGAPAEPPWASAWRMADGACRAAAYALALEEENAGQLSEVGVARELLPALAGGLVQVGNSLAVREVDLLPGELASGLGVLCQRGVNGIDGTVSGAAGAALAAGVPVGVLLGDLAFQHDLGGLAAAALVRTPLPIVVLANGGGRIFELLPLQEAGVSEATFRELFLAPQALDVTAAAAAFRVPSASVGSRAELRTALSEALRRDGPTVIEARISGPGPRERRAALLARVQAVLAARREGGPR